MTSLKKPESHIHYMKPLGSLGVRAQALLFPDPKDYYFLGPWAQLFCPLGKSCAEITHHQVL